MSITINDLIAFAKSKSAPSNTEIETRCIISRAYYAAYHCANNFHLTLSTPGYHPKNPTGMHATLIYQLINPSIPRTDPDYSKSKSIGYILQGLHPIRKNADYELNLKITLNEAKSAIVETEKLVAK